MNSITPVASLAQTAVDLVDDVMLTAARYPSPTLSPKTTKPALGFHSSSSNDLPV